MVDIHLRFILFVCCTLRSEAVERRRQEREKRQRRLQEKVETIHAKQRQSEEKNKWMVPFIVGLAVVVGIGIWYYLRK